MDSARNLFSTPLLPKKDHEKKDIRMDKEQKDIRMDKEKKDIRVDKEVLI
jgi:hypothetical protein